MWPTCTRTLASRGAPVDLTNTAVSVHFLRPGGLQSFLPADVTDAGAGLVQVTLTSQIAAVPGRVDLIIRAVKAEPVEVLFSGTARIEVMANGVDDGAIEASNEFTALTVALAQVQQFEGRIGALETGKLDDAAAELKALLDKPADASIGELARQRLARVLAAQDKAEEGLKLLDGEADKAWQATREELRGDLLVQLGRTDEAHAAYEKAKATLADDAAVGSLQMKLDDLAKGDA